jgi:hypothetical protein
VGVGAAAPTSLVAVSAVPVEGSVVVVSEVVSVVKSVCSDVASMVVERDRSDVIAIPSDSDMKAASLETGADVLADGTARRVVLVAATSCIVEVERSRAEVSSYMLKLHGKGQVFFCDYLPELLGRGLQTLATAVLAAKAIEQKKTPRMLKEGLPTNSSELGSKEKRM